MQRCLFTCSAEYAPRRNFGINRQGNPKSGNNFRRKIFKRFLEPSLLIIILLLTLIINSPAHTLPNFWDKTESDKLADSIVESMSDEELLGQVFFLGYLGKTPSSTIKNWITARGVGGVKIFSRNVKSLPMLAAGISEMQELASRTRFGIPLFIATDQEGGWVRHIKFETSVTPGNLALGAERLPEDSYLTGYYIGMELRKLGINMNFAPTIDVYTNPKASVIGPRSFSSDPVEAAVLAVPYFKGMQKAGIISTAKHFPGHGNADKDSHGSLPIIHTSLKTLNARELVPYRFLINEGDRKSTRLNSSHTDISRMPSSA